MRIAGILLAFALSNGEAPAQPVVADSPMIELKGRIEKIRVSPGEGMPLLEVRSGSSATLVHLGSMRYLMEQDFKPKAGDEIAVKGFRMNSEIFAVTVEHGGRLLRLRDEKGFPAWRGGPHRRGCGVGR